MKGITKRFPGVLALDNIDFSVELGKVIALVGENGAGKSTLMKILSGILTKDQGEILIEGKQVEIDGPLTARNLGISIIYQELMDITNMNIAENIFIGREKRKGLFADKKEMHEQAKELLTRVALDIDPQTKVAKLSTAQRQMIEVAKALSVDAKVIIMDEPTSSLTETETEVLFQIIDRLKKENVAIVFISHRMNEITRISDEVAVMRDGQMVGRLNKDEIDEQRIISMMVGREINDIFAKEEAEISDIALEVKNLNTDFLKDISFHVRKGEVLGFAGLVGAGRSEVMRAVFGIDKKESGEIFIHGKKVEIRNTVDALNHGIGFVPENRKEQGLVLGMSVRSNASLAALNKISKLNFIDKKKEVELADKYIKDFQIRTPSREQLVQNLSGGNQQKVVISKWMATKPDILILDEPTRGVDVGAKKEIHLLMSQLAKQGVAVIMISSELPEVIGMSDRIVVMHEGRIKGEITRDNASQESIMRTALS
ncbi:MAG: sugar ABC transporter ATP-binding protein [Caldicoprobacterales bacterium]|nr:sugar ABC transporter ATP-binding protein [Clostridiales bacterium]